ncbi:DUF6002 family protein [Streptomyces buecherae]|uniref:DUF6002 family protein n=1 Tax=Streptomyces buecherae TaxID=2763006 RepID=UPI0036A8AD17
MDSPVNGAILGTANLILDYPDLTRQSIALHAKQSEAVLDPENFSPGFLLPAMDDAFREFASVATAEWKAIGEYKGHRLTLLDLMGNPGTNTTKTFPSLLIVARAVAHIRETGDRLMLLTPTSANKGVALRDAVWRAISSGLVEPEQLRVVTIAPRSCRHKLRASPLSRDPELLRLNPLLLYSGENPEGVKAVGRAFATSYAGRLRKERDVTLWYSLDLVNYLVADTSRAFFEHAVSPTDESGAPRWHVHSVSSAFGLLGYHAGREVLENARLARPETRPGSLLVQHLGTPDMVLNLLHGDSSPSLLPEYSWDPESGLHHQAGNDPHFPLTTFHPRENLESTFYTSRPATSPSMNGIIGRHGGEGIVVSLAEVIDRYPFLRAWLDVASVPLPADFRKLREWSTAMALTGALNAIDRGLVPAGREMAIHGSGTYTDDHFDPFDAHSAKTIETAEDVADILLERTR